MSSRRPLGWILLVGGALLLLVGATWGHAGYYLSQAPLLMLLVVGGAGLAVIGGLLLRRPKQSEGPVAWRSETESENDEAH